ncbi:hypothetical protein Vretimale_11532 [Volvox reticuliferus]|nr:hypothetical protein Vretifemale_14915 [Volvox reticuliferus]GIM07373.1 hypothetical protein Vretimale_11532 [Volvox reticuliferus]
MQLLLALLPAPKLPEVTQQPTRRPSSASDTFIAHALGRGRASQTGSVSAAPAAPKDAWMQYIDGPPTLPLPTAPLNSHALTANLLQTLSCMLAEPGVQDYWWSVHSTLRPHLQLMYLLRTDAPPKPKAPEQAVPSRRLAGAVAAAAAAAAAAPPPPAPPPDLKVPPFPEEVRTAALQCVLQLVKDPRWLQLAPYLTLLQQTVRQTEDWGPSMVAPLAEILQRIMQRRLPPPARATTGLASLSSPSISPSSPPSLTGDNGPLLPSSAQPQQKRVSGTERPPPLASPLPALTADGTPLPSPSPLHSQRMCNAIPNGLDQAANGLSDVELSSEDAVKALKDLAKMERKGNSDPWATAAVAAALLVLPESAIYAPPWPPLPSPPPTPPPPPLPTSQYLWDALGRPVMTDGIKLAHL